MKNFFKETKYNEGPVHLSRGSLINNWRITKKLGEGGCGSVYMVENIETKKLAALKAESNFVEGGSVLKIEVDILTRMKDKKHTMKLFHFGKRHKYQYMIISLLGESLNSLLRRHKHCSEATQLRVGIHVLHGLKQIHDSGFVHRDIKPANLAVGNTKAGTDPHVIHILDFGLSREFVVRESDGGLIMRKPRKRALFRGTTRYCSASVHEKNEQSRGDDLWSLIYVIVEMRSRLPWHNLSEHNELALAKRECSDAQLLKLSSPHLLFFCQHLRTLDYWTRPDYYLLYKCLSDAMRDNGYKMYTDRWEWEEKSFVAKLANVVRSAETLEESQKTAIEMLDPSKENPYTDADFIFDPLGF